MSEQIAGRYELCEKVAVGWSDDMAQRFPNADHHRCRQLSGRCYGYHCNRCGTATNMYGHHDCPDRVAAL